MLPQNAHHPVGRIALRLTSNCVRVGGAGALFAKTNVNSPCTATDGCLPTSETCCPTNVPIWTYLKSVQSVEGNGKIPWNFEKYLCGKDGVPIQRTGAASSPDTLESKIQELLAA